MSDDTKVSDVDLSRLLGEYTGKAELAHQRYSLNRGAMLAVMMAAGSVAIGVSVFITDYGALKYFIAWPIAIFSVVMMQFYLTKLKTAVELAVWQLRRVYELVSRREDLGLNIDSGARLELELRLSAAAFTLSLLERFDHPEKFQQFRRVGRDSPFRVLEPDDSMLLSTTDPAQTSPAASPDYSVSPS